MDVNDLRSRRHAAEPAAVHRHRGVDLAPARNAPRFDEAARLPFDGDEPDGSAPTERQP